MLGGMLAHCEGGAVACIARGVVLGAVCAVGAAATARVCRGKTPSPPVLFVRKNYVYQASIEQKDELENFLAAQGGERGAMDFIEDMALYWTARLDNRLVGVVFVRAGMWQLQDVMGCAPDALYGTWRHTAQTTMWDTLPTPRGFESRVTTTWNVRALLVARVARAQGVGRALLSALLADAGNVGRNVNLLELHVDKKPQGIHGALVAWYKRAGFVVVQDRREDVHMVCFRDALMHGTYAHERPAVGRDVHVLRC